MGEPATPQRAAVVAVARVLARAPGAAVEREDLALARVRRQMSRGAYLAAIAIRDVLVAAGERGVAVDPAETGAFLALGASNGALDDVLRILAAAAVDAPTPRLDLERFARRGVAACNPLLAFQLMNNFTLCHAAIREGLQGPSGALYGGGPGGAAAAAHALREGVRALADVPWVIVGAADSLIHPVTRFERTQSGLVRPAGEGAIVLLLARAAPAPLAWVELAAAPAASPRAAPAPNAPAAAAAPAASPLAWVELADAPAASPRAAPPPNAPPAADAPDDLGAVEPARAWLAALDAIAEGHAALSVPGATFLAPTPTAAPVPTAAPTATPTPRPPSAARRVAVITGVGATSAYGHGIGALWDGLLRGAPAVGPAPHLPGFPAVAWVPDAARLDGVPDALRAEWARLGWLRDRRLPLTVTAALEAWRGAGCPDGLALSLALGLEQAWLEDFLPLAPAAPATPLDWSRDPGGVALRYRAPLDLPARALAAVLPLAGPEIVHASACAGGALAVAQAAAWIVSGEADRVLCGGGDSMHNPLGLAGLQKLGVLSPQGVGRPFDLRRDGIVVGEGAACFVVEEEGAARRRGAPVLARVLGWGNTQDGYAPTAPRPGGAPARRAMARAVERAGLTPPDIAYVNAHGTGTPLNDEAESAAILDLFGASVPVGSFKGAIGHAMAAAGALELAGCLVAFARGMIPGTPGFSTPDPRCAVAVVRAARPFDGRAVLSSSFGFGGQDASVVLGGPGTFSF